MEIDGYTLKDDLKYDRHNNWVRAKGDIAEFGITDIGVKQARDIAFVELPVKGAAVEKGKPCGQIESAKWAGEIIAPVSGVVAEVNSSLADDPGVMNSDPYGRGWIAKIKMKDPGDAEKLMDAESAGAWAKEEILR